MYFVAPKPINILFEIPVTECSVSLLSAILVDLRLIIHVSK